MLLVMFIWNNQDFVHGEYRRIIQYVGVILLYFVLKQSCDWFGIIFKNLEFCWYTLCIRNNMGIFNAFSI